MDALTPSPDDTAVEAKPAAPKSFGARNEHALIGICSMLVFLAFWEMAVALAWVNPLFISSPSRIVHAGYEMFADGSIYPHLAVSGYEFLVGYGMAIVIGLLLGVLMGWYTRFQYALDPFVNFFYSTPRIVLIPLFILWWGIEMQPKIAVIFLGALFPIIINTMAGVRNTEAALLRVARSFGASDALIFRRVVLPGSVPFILTGFRLGIGHALTGVVVAELIAAKHGVGQLIAISSQTFQTPKMLAGVILIACTGMLLTTLLQRIENRFQSWRPQIR